uniref:Uncharacterized protein n=1 Tax=Schistocephalus solidus TaxID=70667 RepID=A0A0X3PP47_SCHSO
MHPRVSRHLKILKVLVCGTRPAFSISTEKPLRQPGNHLTSEPVQHGKPHLILVEIRAAEVCSFPREGLAPPFSGSASLTFRKTGFTKKNLSTKTKTRQCTSKTIPLYAELNAGVHEH